MAYPTSKCLFLNIKHKRKVYLKEIHQSAKILKPLTDDKWITPIISLQWHLWALEVDVLEAEKMDKCKDLSDSDKR